MTLAYVDASALAKLLLVEPGSTEMLRWYLETDRVITSRIGVIETRRAVARREPDLSPARIDIVLRSVEVFELDADLARHASLIDPPSLRTLDAVHLATALAVGPIDAFVTYDDRLADAARAVGLPVVRPA